MPYFDVTLADHLALLPEPLREASDLASLAAAVEVDVILGYTIPIDEARSWARPISQADILPSAAASSYRGVPVNDREIVCLDGYTVDPAQAPPRLAELLRRTIADVLRWRLEQRQRNTAVLSESTYRGTTRTYVPGHDGAYPPSWRRWLQAYDLRPRTYLA